MSNDFLAETFYREWDRLMDLCGIPASARRSKAIADIVAAYTQLERYYHNLDRADRRTPEDAAAMIDVLPEIRPLLAEDRLNELGPGQPNLAVKPLLQELQRNLPKIAKERAFASACLAGLWLYHDFFDESHAISQDLDMLEGRYWHAILHRREPDYWNAKYWFRRVPAHPIFGELAEKARQIAQARDGPGTAVPGLSQDKWDPAGFVDLCEKAAGGQQSLAILCRQIQKCEWELLFRYCHLRAFQ